MELNAFPQTAVEQSFFSNIFDNPKIHLTIGNNALVLSNLYGRAIYNPQYFFVTSLFNLSSPFIDISCSEEQQKPILLVEKINSCLNILSISKKTLCSILNITRPTLYSWIERDDIKPEEKNIKKVAELYKILITLPEPMILYHEYVEEKIENESKSLLETIKTSENLLINEDIKRILNKVYLLTKERNKRLEKIFMKDNPYSKNKQDLILEDNIISL